MVLGAIIGGTSSPIVIPLASRLTNLENRAKMILSIESILTDPLAIVVFLALFFMITAGEPDIWGGINRLVSTFSVGAVVGIAVGGGWLPVMHHIRKEQFAYVVTLAIAFLMFSLTESWWSGAGAISCLMFGLVLGNGKKILKMVNYHGRGFEMDEPTKQSHALISFVMRTFFFVFLGMMVTYQEVKIEFIIIGIIILLALLGLRYLAVIFTTFRGDFERDDKLSMTVMMPRGLAAAILAIIYGPELVKLSLPSLSGFYEGIVFVIILGTAIICTTGVSIICHRQHKPIEKKETSVDFKEEIDLMSKDEK
jgi:cell volume regulation protein A